MAESKPKPIAERIHDLRTTLADFRAVLRLLQGGYRFDDDDAPAVFVQLEKALGHLEAEILRIEAEGRDRG